MVDKDGELVDVATVEETELLEIVVPDTWVLDTTTEVATLIIAVLDLVVLELEVPGLGTDKAALLEA